MPTRNRWGHTFTKGTPVIWHGARGGGPYHGQYIKLAPRDGFSSAYGRQALVWTAVGKIPARVSEDHPDVVEVNLNDLKVAGLRAVKGRRAAAKAHPTGAPVVFKAGTGSITLYTGAGTPNLSKWQHRDLSRFAVVAKHHPRMVARVLWPAETPSGFPAGGERAVKDLANIAGNLAAVYWSVSRDSKKMYRDIADGIYAKLPVWAQW